MPEQLRGVAAAAVASDALAQPRPRLLGNTPKAPSKVAKLHLKIVEIRLKFQGLLYFDANRWLPQSEDGHTHTKPMRRIDGTARTDFDPNCYGKSNGDGCYFWPSETGTPISSSRYGAPPPAGIG